MNKKIQSQVLKEVLKDKSLRNFTSPALFVEKAISRAVELKEEESFNEKIILEDTIKKGEKAEFRKMIEEVFEENRKASETFENKEDPVRLTVLHLCNSIEQIILSKLGDNQEVGE